MQIITQQNWNSKRKKCRIFFFIFGTFFFLLSVAAVLITSEIIYDLIISPLHNNTNYVYGKKFHNFCYFFFSFSNVFPFSHRTRSVFFLLIFQFLLLMHLQKGNSKTKENLFGKRE